MMKANVILGHSKISAPSSSFKCKSSPLQVAEGKEGASVRF
jgi:hypothetical protein